MKKKNIQITESQFENIVKKINGRNQCKIRNVS